MPTDMPTAYPVLPLRDIVIFPKIAAPLFVGREKSVAALEEALLHDRRVFLVPQKDGKTDEPEPKDLYETATLGTILQLIKLPDGTVKVLVEGLSRAVVKKWIQTEKVLQAEVEPLEENLENSEELVALTRMLVEQFSNYVKIDDKSNPEKLIAAVEAAPPSVLADTIAHHSRMGFEEKIDLLGEPHVLVRLRKLFNTIEGEIEVLKTERKIRSRVKKQMERTQREYYLNEQMKAIQKELGDGVDPRDELRELELKLGQMTMPKEAREKCDGELRKLRQMSPASAEATVVRNYLETILELPWKKKNRLSKDLKRAEAILEEDHYGLEKVKERILDYLAVQIRAKKLKGPILCLVGPPGVGKTSLGRSIARATGRKFGRISLGGVRDEAEIRGHRRTYIGAMPGRIIQALKKVKTGNPLLMLDEIDKLSNDWRGDPSSALLEVLDPEQNSFFTDHYLELEYDLSDVMFVTTANSLLMPRPLLDRMEVIRIAGYTEDEKMTIARRHLLPKLEAAHSLKKQEWTLPEKPLLEIIRYYTREAGLRNLERELATLARKTVRKILTDQSKKVIITQARLGAWLGPRKFLYGVAETKDQVGIVTGLAWTEVGGELLTIESVLTPGRGRITKTGKLGDVMRESIEAAWHLVYSRAPMLGIDPNIFEKIDLHLHVPNGATPKDGPSAGIGMVTSIVSLLTNVPVRRDVAMTGEVTLRGRVLPIGGLKEKLLAAKRGGLKSVIIPHENKKDLEEVPSAILSNLRITPVEEIEDVLRLALTRPLQPLDINLSEYITTRQTVPRPPEDFAPVEDQDEPRPH